VNAELALSWSTGKLVLQDRSLGEVIREIDRYYPGTIILANSEAAKRRVNAVVDLDHIDDWVAALTRSQGVKARYFAGVVFLS
jgi:transmembrane sensor